MSAQTILTYEIRDDELVIRIGIVVLAFAQDARETPYKVVPGREMEFAKEVLLGLQQEQEDGSTPVTRVLDEAADYAEESGSDSLYDFEENDEEGSR